MKKLTQIDFTWKYSPPEYLDTSISLNTEKYELTMGEGTAKAVVKENLPENAEKIGNELTNLIRSYFIVVQLNKNTQYLLKRFTYDFIYSDGSITHVISCSFLVVSHQYYFFTLAFIR